MKPEGLSGKALQRDILQKVNNLQPMPQVLQRAMDLIGDADVPLKKVTGLIESDPSIAMSVLRLANSPYYRRLEPVASIHDAAVALGMGTLSEILLMAFAAKPLSAKMQGYELPSLSLWQHSLAVACGAKILAGKTFPQLAGQAFSAGLIHDVGKIVLDGYVVERKTEIAEFMDMFQQPFLRAEQAVFGFDHAAIAGRICEKWRFSRAVTDAVKYHHAPGQSRTGPLAHLVGAADQLASWLGMEVDGLFIDVADESFEKLGLKITEIEPVMDEIAAAVEKITASA